MKNIQLSTRAIIIKGDHMLFIKHSDHPVYYLVGGTIEHGESSVETLERELFEELKLHLEIDKLAIINERFLQFNGKPFHEVQFYYLLKNCDNINAIEGSNTDKTQETLHWLPIDKLTEYNVVPSFLKTYSFANIDKPEHIITKEF